MAVTIKPLFTVSSLCGKVELSKGEICQVCWTDGRGRMTVWGHPRCMFSIANFVLLGYDKESANDLRILKLIGFKPKEETPMNSIQVVPVNLAARVIEAASDTFTTVKVEFSAADPRTYTYKAPKSFGVAVGDKVVVDSPREGYKVVTVVEVHDKPLLRGDFDFKWLVSKIDDSNYKELIAFEEQANKRIQDAIDSDKRAEHLKQLRAVLPEESATRSVVEDLVKAVTGITPAA